MTSTTATTVLLDVTVDVPVGTAFRLFTEHFDQVKPREYNLLDVPIEETVLEPRVGGHIYDRAADGTTCRWARVLAFEPLEHRHLDRHGEGWEGYAAGMASPGAWPLFLSRFEALTKDGSGR